MPNECQRIKTDINLHDLITLESLTASYAWILHYTRLPPLTEQRQTPWQKHFLQLSILGAIDNKLTGKLKKIRRLSQARRTQLSRLKLGHCVCSCIQKIL